jgi:hypothetical protein
LSQSFNVNPDPRVVLNGLGGTSSAVVFPDTFYNSVAAGAAVASNATFQPNTLSYVGGAGFTVTSNSVPLNTAYGQPGDTAIFYGNRFTAASPARRAPTLRRARRPCRIRRAITTTPWISARRSP